MRRAVALATLAAVAFGSAAAAETWTKFVDAGNGTEWSYDADYTYKDRQSGRLVVMQAISKPASKLGPSGPGKPDGVGYVYALDCKAKNLISLAQYTPSKPLEIAADWRKASPKKAAGPENEALLAAVCPHAERAPVK